MSDLRSEMVNKVLSQWDGVNMDKQYKSFGEQVFDYVTKHPYVTISEVKNALDADDTRSSASMLKLLVDRGILARVERPVTNYPGFGRRTQWEYYAVSDKYETKNQGYWRKEERPKRGRPLGSKNTPRIVIETGTPDRMATVPRETPMEQGFNPEMFVQELSLKDAKAVFEVLKGYFGD